MGITEIIARARLWLLADEWAGLDQLGVGGLEVMNAMDRHYPGGFAQWMKDVAQ